MNPVSSFNLGPHLFQTFSEKPNSIENIYEVTQVHSAQISTWEEVNSDSLEKTQGKPIEADGICYLYDEHPRPYDLVHLAIKTADCLSIAIIGTKGVINLHAGWRGLAGEILTHPLVHKCEPHTFLLSAAIDREDYEVGEEFKEIFSSYPKALKVKEAGHDQKLTFSLHITATQMISSLYPEATIIRDKHNTFTHPALNSYRRNKTQNRNWNVLSINLK